MHHAKCKKPDSKATYCVSPFIGYYLKGKSVRAGKKDFKKGQHLGGRIKHKGAE